MRFSYGYLYFNFEWSDFIFQETEGLSAFSINATNTTAAFRTAGATSS